MSTFHRPGLQTGRAVNMEGLLMVKWWCQCVPVSLSDGQHLFGFCIKISVWWCFSHLVTVLLCVCVSAGCHYVVCLWVSVCQSCVPLSFDFEGLYITGSYVCWCSLHELASGSLTPFLVSPHSVLKALACVYVYAHLHQLAPVPNPLALRSLPLCLHWI